ncbi:MAG: NAD(P)/FAD-dependent oxidoreductase [Clostridiales bacterium]|nr:NAD(P)/FAD-dependent oxidoreductase [Clostridiales bacterium]
MIGAGPAGLAAAISAAECGARVMLFEKNAQPGRKLLLTRNGRCNLTNRLSKERYPDCYFGNGKFLIKALHTFGPEETELFFESVGVQLIEEAGGRVFPSSGHASDILEALKNRAEQCGVRIKTGESVVDVRRNRSGGVSRIVSAEGTHVVDACVLCAGGKSYPTTGSSGDGAVIAARLGHKIMELRPALAPVDIFPADLAQLAGVSLRDVRVTMAHDGKPIVRRRGDVLFTHYGLSGPAVLMSSRSLPIGPDVYEGRVRVEIDLLPDIADDEAGKWMLDLVRNDQNTKITHVLRTYFPASLIAHLFERAGVSTDIYGHDMTKEDRKKLLGVIRCLSYRVARPPLFSSAMVTAGGVSLKEVDPKTMQSRIVNGLFFAGEVLDIDGETGGFNLQAAFSTGFVAGRSAAEYTGSIKQC